MIILCFCNSYSGKVKDGVQMGVENDGKILNHRCFVRVVKDCGSIKDSNSSSTSSLYFDHVPWLIYLKHKAKVERVQSTANVLWGS